MNKFLILLNNKKSNRLPRIALPLLLALLTLGPFLFVPIREHGYPYSKRPTYWPLIQETHAARLTNDLRVLELVPSTSIVFHGERFTTNRWGIRDQDYELTPSYGTYRIVILGSSIDMGSGVADHEVFEGLLENRLNEEFSGSPYNNYEILNFGVASHASLQGLYVFEETALRFNPNALFLITHQFEETDFIPGLANRLSIGVGIPYPEINDIVQRAGIEAGMSKEEIERLIHPFAGEIISWIYQHIVTLAKERNILPFWVYLPALEYSEFEYDYNASLQRVEKAGFITIDLSDLYSNQDVRSLIVAEWDLHPNGRGHQLIADRLYQAILANTRVRKHLALTINKSWLANCKIWSKILFKLNFRNQGKLLPQLQVLHDKQLSNLAYFNGALNYCSYLHNSTLPRFLKSLVPITKS